MEDKNWRSRRQGDQNIWNPYDRLTTGLKDTIKKGNQKEEEEDKRAKGPKVVRIRGQ